MIKWAESMKGLKFAKTVEEFLKEPNFMVISTLFSDGSIQSTIVWFLYKNGKFLVSTTRERVKFRNLSRDSRTTCLIYDRDNSYRYVQIKGKSYITEAGGHKLIDDLSLRYVGKTPYHGDPEHKQNRVIITVTPTKYFSVGF